VRVRSIALTLAGTAATLVPLAMRSIGSPISETPVLLPVDIAVLGVGCTVVLAVGRSSKGRLARCLVSAACGALLGAGLIGPCKLLPFVLTSILAFSLAANGLGPMGLRAMIVRSGCVVAATILNFALLWPFLLGQHRPVSHDEFLAMNLRVHTLLEDVPLHDLWAAQLQSGGEDWDLLDLNDAMSMSGGISGNDRVALLGVLGGYLVLSRIFGWHDDSCIPPDSSVQRRLTEVDRERSRFEPGQSPFVYHFEREALIEIQTCIAHALYAYVLVPGDQGYTLYWAAYAKRVGWFTPYYMALIDPVRKLIVFPSWMERIEKAWILRWGR
jgi:hypothetical protein